MARKKNPGQESTGSSEQGEPVFIALGFLRRSHGVLGEIVMDVLTDFPERLKAGRVVYVGDAHVEYRLGSVRPAGKHYLVRLRGIDTPEAAAQVRNQYMFTREEDLEELPEGSYYVHQVIGLAVVDEQGQPLGELIEVLHTGANDVYVVRNAEGKELLLPAIDEVILDVDLAAGQMRVRPQDWS